MRGWSYITTYKKAALFTAVLVLASCNYNTQKANSNGIGGGPDQGSLSGNTIISFELVSNFSLSTCTKCHAGVNKPTLDSIETFRANISTVMSQVDGGQMPPANKGFSPLNDCQKALLRKWVDTGMAEKSVATVADVPECKTAGPINTTPDPITPIELMPLNYDTLNTRIIQPKCIMCHDTGGEAELYPFYPYSLMMDKDLGSGNEWKAPGIQSKVHRAIIAADDDDDLMPPLDSKIPRLTPAEIDYIVRWIDAGHPEK